MKCWLIKDKFNLFSVHWPVYKMIANWPLQLPV